MARVYYNELDTFAADWLESLITERLLPPGDVDRRSIVDVQPTDLVGYRQCHFFAGIGGWAYAALLAGWPADRDLWTGSCPCQPFSVAGKGRGTDDARHLWPDFFRLIRARRPAVVMGEQVAGKAGRDWFDGVAADLEGDGYACRAVDIPACAVDAPHIRSRLYWIAVADADHAKRRPNGARWHEHGRQAPRWIESDGDTCERGLGHSDSTGLALRQGERSDAGPELAPALGTGRNGSFWSDAEWLLGADGKSRRAQSGVRLLAAGATHCLERLCAIEVAAIEEVVRYGLGKRNTRENLRMVRDHIREEQGRQEQSTGMRQQFYEAPLLLDFLLCLEAACDGTAKRSGEPQTRDEAQYRIVRSLLHNGGDCSPPRRRQSDEQLGEQSSDSMLELSFILARHAEAYRTAAIDAHAASGRIGRLRGFGNAIVPPLAAEVIRSFLDAELTP